MMGVLGSVTNTINEHPDTEHADTSTVINLFIALPSVPV